MSHVPVRLRIHADVDLRKIPAEELPDAEETAASMLQIFGLAGATSATIIFPDGTREEFPEDILPALLTTT